MKQSTALEQTQKARQALESLLKPPSGEPSELRYTRDVVKAIVDGLKKRESWLPRYSLELPHYTLETVFRYNTQIETSEQELHNIYDKVWMRAQRRILRNITKEERLEYLPEEEKEKNTRYLKAKSLEKPLFRLKESLDLEGYFYNDPPLVVVSTILSQSQSSFEWVIAHELGHFFERHCNPMPLAQPPKEKNHAEKRAKEKRADLLASSFVNPIQGVQFMDFKETVEKEIATVKKAVREYFPNINALLGVSDPAMPFTELKARHKQIEKSRWPRFIKDIKHRQADHQAETKNDWAHPSDYSRKIASHTTWQKRILEYPCNPLGIADWP